MQVVLPQPTNQPAPIAAPVGVPVTDRRSPPEPSRRVTANREGGKADLSPKRNLRSAASSPRGQIVDLFV